MDIKVAMPLGYGSSDLWTTAQTLWGEARGEGASGMVAVAWVIRNRHELHPRWRGMPLLAICRAPWQFSAWNAHDPNLEKMLGVTPVDTTFFEALVVTIDVMGGTVVSPVGRATHYYARGTTPPAWAQARSPVALVGNHLFFEDIA